MSIFYLSMTCDESVHMMEAFLRTLSAGFSIISIPCICTSNFSWAMKASEWR